MKPAVFLLLSASFCACLPGTLAQEPPDYGDPDGLRERIGTEVIDLESLFEAAEIVLDEEAQVITLQGSVLRALEENADLIVSAYEPMKGEADILSARGIFDPVLSGSVNYARSSQQASPEAQLYGGITSIDAYRSTGQATVAGRIGIGMEYALSLNVAREETTFNQFQTEHSGGVTVSVTQPLLRGRGRNYNLASIRAARTALGMSEAEVQLAAMQKVAEVVRAYWDLVAATENVRVRQESLDNAKRLLDITERMRDIGTAAEIEVLQAKAGVSARQSDLIAARSSVSDAEDNLKRLLNMTEGGRLAAVRLEPIDRPEYEEVEIDIDESIRTALEKRPEVETAQLDIRRSEIEMARSRMDTLPRLDVQWTLTQGARGPYMRDVFRGIGAIDEGFMGIFEGMPEKHDTTYTFGVTGSVPIGNRAARGSYERARLTLRQAEYRLERIRQDVMLGVQLAARGVRTSRVLVLNNRNTRTLQEANVMAEERRLRLGVTTSYRVLQVQEDLTNAQTQEVQALISFQKALVDLDLARGVLLENLGVTFEGLEPQPRISFVRSVLDPAFPWPKE